jgi:hypothetical protein
MAAKVIILFYAAGVWMAISPAHRRVFVKAMGVLPYGRRRPTQADVTRHLVKLTREWEAVKASDIRKSHLLEDEFDKFARAARYFGYEASTQFQTYRSEPYLYLGKSRRY